VTDISPETRLIKAHFCEQPRIAARLPKGDVLLAGSREDTAAFSIGGSRLIEGPALIVGRHWPGGQRGRRRSASYFGSAHALAVAAIERVENRRR